MRTVLHEEGHYIRTPRVLAIVDDDRHEAVSRVVVVLAGANDQTDRVAGDGCLRETLARFRPDSEAELFLAAITGIDTDDLDPEARDSSGVGDWLSMQRVGTVRVLNVGSFIDIEQPSALIALDKHPVVRAAIETLDRSGHLDIGLLRLGGRIGRPVSQGVGLAVREWLPQVLGIGYRSRLATDEPCWAIWGNVTVDVVSVALDPDDPQHRDAIRSVAAEFEIDLPNGW